MSTDPTEFDFETPHDRANFGSTKWGKYGDADILPMWVADCDFRGPAVITEAMTTHLTAHGVLGYSRDAWPNATVSAYLARQYAWQVAPEHIVTLPGLVCGLNVTARTFATPQTPVGVITPTPAYPYFMSAATWQGAHSITAHMRESNGHWTLDFDALENAVLAHQNTFGTDAVKLFMLCHPHNPTGRVWSMDELAAIGAFCERHGLFVCSDEIHCDLILDETKLAHVPFAKAFPALRERTITLMAPSKTFNIAGMGAAVAVIQNPELRATFEKAKAGIVPHVNVLGHVAMMAAWSGACEPWRQACLRHLRKNGATLAAAINAIPGLHTRVPEATFLMWVDCRARFPEHAGKAFEAVGLGPNDGAEYGQPGFVRFNLGCSAATIDEAILRLQKLR